MRLDGVTYKKISCLNKVEITLPILLSFDVLEMSDNTIKASNFLPPGIEKILLNKEFYIYKDKKRTKRLLRARIKEIINNIVHVITLDDEVLDEKRLFERIAVCIQEKFKVLELNIDAFILDMSLGGVKLFFEKNVDIKPNQVLTLQHRSKILTLKVLRREEEKNGVILGCEIESSSFNLLNYLVKNYVEQVKEILI